MTKKAGKSVYIIAFKDNIATLEYAKPGKKKPCTDMVQGSHNSIKLSFSNFLPLLLLSRPR